MYRWVDHTSEVELEIRAPSEAEIFEQATEAIAELLGAQPGGGTEQRELTVAGTDRAALLAEWIDELVFCAETEGFVPARCLAVELRSTNLNALVAGETAAPPHLIKAVTYHRLAFERAPDGWEARVVIDV